MNKLNSLLRSYPENYHADLSNNGYQKEDLNIVNNRFLFLKKNGKFEKVAIDNILCIQASGNYTDTITDGGKYMNNMNLGQMEELFPSANFIRVHRSYIVNIKNITSIDFANYKIFLGNHEVPFSRNLKEELSKRLNIIR